MSCATRLEITSVRRALRRAPGPTASWAVGDALARNAGAALWRAAWTMTGARLRPLGAPVRRWRDASTWACRKRSLVAGCTATSIDPGPDRSAVAGALDVVTVGLRERDDGVAVCAHGRRHPFGLCAAREHCSRTRPPCVGDLARLVDSLRRTAAAQHPQARHWEPTGSVASNTAKRERAVASSDSAWAAAEATVGVVEP